MKKMKTKKAFMVVNTINPRIDPMNIFSDTDAVLAENEIWKEVEIKVLSTVVKAKRSV